MPKSADNEVKNFIAERRNEYKENIGPLRFFLGNIFSGYSRPCFEKELPKFLRATNDNPTKVQFLECLIKYFNSLVSVDDSFELEIYFRFLFPNWDFLKQDTQEIFIHIIFAYLQHLVLNLKELSKFKLFATEIINTLQATPHLLEMSDLMLTLAKNDLLVEENIEALKSKQANQLCFIKKMQEKVVLSGFASQGNFESLLTMVSALTELQTLIYYIQGIPNHIFNKEIFDRLVELSQQPDPELQIKGYIDLLINPQVISVDASVSEFATELHKRYGHKIEGNRLEVVLNDIKTHINNLPKSHISEVAQRCIKRILAPDYSFTDPISGLTIKQAMALTYFALQDDTKRIGAFEDGMRQCIHGLYEIQRGNIPGEKGKNIDYGAEDRPKSASATFNKLLHLEWFRSDTNVNYVPTLSQVVHEEIVNFLLSSNLSNTQTVVKPNTCKQLIEENSLKVIKDIWSKIRSLKENNPEFIKDIWLNIRSKVAYRTGLNLNKFDPQNEPESQIFKPDAVFFLRADEVCSVEHHLSLKNLGRFFQPYGIQSKLSSSLGYRNYCSSVIWYARGFFYIYSDTQILAIEDEQEDEQEIATQQIRATEEKLKESFSGENKVATDIEKVHAAYRAEPAQLYGLISPLRQASRLVKVMGDYSEFPVRSESTPGNSVPTSGSSQTVQSAPSGNIKSEEEVVNAKTDGSIPNNTVGDEVDLRLKNPEVITTEQLAIQEQAQPEIDNQGKSDQQTRPFPIGKETDIESAIRDKITLTHLKTDYEGRVTQIVTNHVNEKTPEEVVVKAQTDGSTPNNDEVITTEQLAIQEQAQPEIGNQGKSNQQTRPSTSRPTSRFFSDEYQENLRTKIGIFCSMRR